MTKEMILLVLNLVLVGFLLLGFLFGLKGLKKSSIRLACFLVGVFIALIITSLVSKAIMQINITYEGTKMSIENFILTKINEVPEIADVTSKSATVKDLIAKFPVMIGNIFVFVILTYVLSFLSWIVYLVFARVINKGYKERKKQGVKVKKHRLLGGLVGSVQALILVCLTFLPVCGFAGIIHEIQNTAQAEEVSQTEQSASAKLLNENLPKEVTIIVDAYNGSILSKVGNVFGMGDRMFNNIASISVDGNRIALRDEILNLSKVYDNVSFLMDMDTNTIDLSKMDYDKLINAIDYIFSSNLLKTVVPDFFDYLCDQALSSDTVKNDADLTATINVLKTELKEDNKLVENLKTELNCVLNTMKTLKDAKVFDEISTGENAQFTRTNLINILDILYGNNKKIFNNVIDECFNSKILNRSLLYGLNQGVKQLEEKIQDLVKDETISINKLDLTDKTLAIKKAEVKSLLGSLLDIGNEVKNFDFDGVSDDIRTVSTLKLGDITKNLGQMMNAVQNMSVFKDSDIYNQILTALDKTKYNKYINFAVLKGNNIWITETQNMAQTLDKLLESKILDENISLNDKSYSVSNENLTKIFTKLAQTSLINGQEETLLTQILQPIYDSKMFEKVIDLGFEKLSDYVQDFGNEIDKDTQIGKLNLNNIHTEQEKTKIFNFLNSIVNYAKDLDITKFKEDKLNTLVDTDLSKLGECLDNLRATSMFSDYTNDNDEQVLGVYSQLADALNKKYGDNINFAITKESTFSYKDEFANIQGSVQKMIDEENDITLDNGTKQHLFNYLLSDDRDMEVVMKQVGTDKLTEIFTPLLESKLLRPLAVQVVNEINKQVKDLVGSYGDKINVDINVEDLTDEEIEQVVEIMTNISTIIDEIDKITNAEDNYDLETLVKGEKAEQVAGILNSLQENANNNGVFTETYNAMKDYITNDKNVGEDIKSLISENTITSEDGTTETIDWQKVLEGLKTSTTPSGDTSGTGEGE